MRALVSAHPRAVSAREAYRLPLPSKRVARAANSRKPRALRRSADPGPAHIQNCGDMIVRLLPFFHVQLGGTIMKTITLGVTTMLLLAAITMTAMPQSQMSNTAYEKKSYNYAEWAKGRFSEVVTVRNAGTIIYLGGVGAAAWSASRSQCKMEAPGGCAG